MKILQYLSRHLIPMLAVFAAGAGALPMLSQVVQQNTPAALQLKEDPAPLGRRADGPLPTSYAPIIKKAAPSVVNIYTTRTIKVRPNPFLDDPFFRRFFGEPDRRRQQPRQRKQQSLGSGVIITANGYIVTNNHVVADVDEIKVTTADKKEFKAKVVGTDPKTDLAVLKVDAAGLPAVTITDSDAVEIGDIVFAIGNPFGVGQTVTQGIISAKSRGIGMLDYEDFIQTDAAINPGNSGGALIDAQGRLIGINTAILSRSGGSQGIGFAIPLNMVKRIMRPLLKDGKVSRGFLGVMIQNVTPELKEAFDLPDRKGALVSGVTPDSAAAKAGIEKGDLIVAFNGKAVKDVRHLRFLVAGTPPSKTATVTVWRDGKRRELKVKLQEMPEGELTSDAGDTEKDVLRGVTVQQLTDQDRERLNAPDGLQGLLVKDIAGDAPAADAGLRRGDVITQMFNRDVATVADARELLEKHKGKNVLLHVWRQGGGQFLVVKPEKK